MTKGLMVVESEPGDPEGELEYNEWYRNVHIPQLLAVPGFTGVRRYKIRPDLTPGEVGRLAYLTVYDLEADDLGKPVNEMRERAAARRAHGDAEGPPLSPATVVTVYELFD